MSSKFDLNVAVFCDFNGTITDRDMLRALLAESDRLDLLQWLDSEEAKGLTLRERLSAQASAITYSLEDAEAIVERAIGFDETFPAFYFRCIEAGIEFTILSSGIGDLIGRYLRRRGMNEVRIVANGADYRPDGWQLIFRDRSPQGNSKVDHVARARWLRKWTVVIGDDESDFEAAVIADHRSAKRGSPLDRFLKAGLLDREVFTSFSDIQMDWPRP